MAAKFVYLVKFVGDMAKAVAFHRDVLGLKARFESPFWSEFDTGPTTLALHPATPKNPAGTCQPGFRVADLKEMFAEREGLGVTFSAEPTTQRGVLIGKFLDSDGAENTISEGF
jgi:catechol 2,3-dioxygenase-like lactoylglutathione lyase family enzyme